MSLRFSPKDHAEVLFYAFDFARRLEDGETITTCAFSSSPVLALGTGTALEIVGSATIAGSVVRQLVQGGDPGLTYRLKATIETSAGRTVVGSALVAVEDGGG
jgi:hypothetical protein